MVYQVAVSQMANKRQNTAHTKDRSEVRGGGVKPWRQKGTGRARHGSRRSPLWPGGGITFGPRNERNYKRVIPKKMKKKALLMVLSAKAKEDFLTLVDNLPKTEAKTKALVKFLSVLPCKKESCLILSPAYNKDLLLSVRNLPQISLMETRNISVLDLLNYKYVLTDKEGVKTLEAALGKEK